MTTNTKTGGKSIDSSIAAQNNDKIANLIFTVMTGIVFLGSFYLYYNLNDYLEGIHTSYPDYKFPEFKDYNIALLFVPIYIVIYQYLILLVF